VQVEVAVLREALLVTAPRRHGNPSKKSLEAKHIDALAKLDAHPGLSSLHSEYGDRQEAKERVRDMWRRGHAEDYLAILSQEEIERRILAAQDLLPFDPKERLTSLGLQDYPVCDQETLLPSPSTTSVSGSAQAPVLSAATTGARQWWTTKPRVSCGSTSGNTSDRRCTVSDSGSRGCA
jgi:hypothetical protein